MTRAQNAYRNGYLKSEHWDKLRMEVLVREKGKCFVCGFESSSNDVHHVFYPKRWRDAKPYNLHVLCRSCHIQFHKLENPSKGQTTKEHGKNFKCLAIRIRRKLEELEKRKQAIRQGKCQCCRRVCSDVEDVNHIVLCKACSLKIAIHLNVSDLDKFRRRMKPFIWAFRTIRNQMDLTTMDSPTTSSLLIKPYGLGVKGWALPSAINHTV